MIQWQTITASRLSARQLYALLRLRCEVFIVEQNCVYQDIDGRDLDAETLHVLGWGGDELVSCARIMPQSQRVVIGRVIVAVTQRGAGVGQQLMARALAECGARWPGRPVYLSAQAHLQNFYQRLGFQPVTEVYDEDGIAHLGMQIEGGQANFAQVDYSQ